jgi:hypothetical protein
MPVERVSDAVCFCMIGAILAASGKMTFGGPVHPATIFLENAIEKYESSRSVEYPAYSVAEFNDSSTHEEVLAAYDFAIKLAEEEEAELETAS